MRPIDADALLPMMKYATIDSEIGVFPIKIGFDAIAKVIDDAPTVDAVPVELIQKRIEALREVADAEFELNGGYVGSVFSQVCGLEGLLREWTERKEEE